MLLGRFSASSIDGVLLVKSPWESVSGSISSMHLKNMLFTDGLSNVPGERKPNWIGLCYLGDFDHKRQVDAIEEVENPDPLC